MKEQPAAKKGGRPQNQDTVIDQAIEKSKGVTVFLRNGVHLSGKVIAHDPYTILMETDKNRTLVYKHTVTSISTR